MEENVRCLSVCASLQDAYPDRGQSPERLQAVAEGRKQGKNLTAAPKAAGYVPPHLRGANGQKKEKEVEGFDADEVSFLSCESSIAPADSPCYSRVLLPLSHTCFEKQNYTFCYIPRCAQWGSHQ
jgi:hypothetical protein